MCDDGAKTGGTPLVVRRGEGLRYERDYAFEKAIWDFQAAPALGGVLLAFLAYASWKLIHRLSGPDSKERDS